MTRHDLWHVAVLGSTLLTAAGAAIVGLASLLFEEPPPGLAKARSLVLVSIGLAGGLLALEWLGVH